MIHTRLLLTVLIFFVCGQTYCQSNEAVANTNLSYLYNQKGGFFFSAYSLTNKGSTSITLEITGSNEVNAFNISYYVTDDLDRKSDDTFPIKVTTNDKSGISATAEIQGIKAKYLVFIIQDIRNHNTYVYPFFIASKWISSGIQPFIAESDIPVTNNFVFAKNAIKFTSITSPSDSLYLNHYHHYFQPASPPMSLSQKTPKQLSISDQYYIDVNKAYDLQEEGLYYIQNDSTSNSGITLRVQNASFPKQKDMQQLIETLIYLCSKSEYQALKSSLDKKKSFEQFWLRITNSEESAKRVIKHYYGNVTNANRLFTTYKEGWKTDMGMIYIIFGSPDRVYKNNNNEQWHYDKTDEYSKTTFEFIRLENAFSDSHYVLQRHAEYKPIWFRLVDLWRKGRKEM